MESIIIDNKDTEKSRNNLQMKEDLSAKPRHLIQVVNRRTGLSSDVIRVWEKRYQAVVSHRNDTNRRLYSDKDIDKLTLLKRAIAAGRRIGDVASLMLLWDINDQALEQLWSYLTSQSHVSRI